MRIKLFNGLVTTTQLSILGGGYDPDSQRVQLIVRGEQDKTAGVVTFDVNEAYRVAELLQANLPKVQRVEGVDRLTSAISGETP